MILQVTKESRGWLHQILQNSCILSLLCGVGIHILDLLRMPPKRLPFLHDAMFVSLPFVHLMLAAIHLNVRQWQIEAGPRREQTKQD